VPENNPTLDILTETVTDSRAAPSVTPQMRTLFDELDKAASQSASIIAASLRKPATAAQRRAKKRPNQKRVNSYWSCFIVAFLIGIVALGVQILARDAIWSALNLPVLKYWYSYVPRDVLRFLVKLTGSPQLILVTGPFVYPVAAIGISFCVALAAGVGKKRIDAIVRLAGFAWDRNSFCRGFLITGSTGSGKTLCAIVGIFHQVFRGERGLLRDSWIGSELENKVEEIQANYQRETDPIYEKLSSLRTDRLKLEEALELALQRTLIGDITYQSMSAEERVQHAEAMKVEIRAKIDQKLEALRSQRSVLLEQCSQLGPKASLARTWMDASDEQRSTWLAKSPGEIIEGNADELEAKIASYKSAIVEMDSEIAATKELAKSVIGPDVTSVAAVEYRALQEKAERIEADIGRIEWLELQPIKRRFDELMKKIEQAKYKAFPWGGLCIDEKGLFWQTLVPIARHYKREHHLMLLQTRPNWAPPEWKPQARFNVLSDRKIKTSTYAKAIVDTAGSIAGGHEESPFFKTQAQKWIEASIDLQWGVRDFQIFNGLSQKNAILPSLKRSLELLTTIDAYREWLISEHILQPEKPAAKAPAAVGSGPSAAQAKKLAGLAPEDPAFLNSLPELLRRSLIDFKRAYWSQPTEQLGGVIGTINNYLTYFAGDDVAEVFCADNTFDIKDMDRGMILLLAMPQKLQTERRYVCTLLKLLFYQHVSDRFDLKSDSDAWINKNVLILWQDEAQSFASEADKVVDKIREAYGTTVMATQSMLSLFPPLGGKEKADVVLLNLRNRVVFQVADEESAKITADFIGKREVTRKDRSVSVSSRQHTTYNYRKEEQHKIKPAVLRELPKYTAVVCHCDGKFRKVLMPPRDHEGKIARWWLDRDAPFFFKCGVQIGVIK
jgi:Type IV secretion-system coupling protein DNA-binding domain